MISVVIVTWNRKEDVLEAVRSVQQQKRPGTAGADVQVVVVDNGSTDGTADALEKYFGLGKAPKSPGHGNVLQAPSAMVVSLPENLGASGGRNPGIAAAQGDILFFLDSDASLAPDTLQVVADRFRADPRLGIIACKIVNATTGKLDPNSGWIFSERDKQDQDREFLSYSFCSAGSAVRREVIEEVGPFWERLFIYREEDDLSLRAWDAGYRVVYCPEALVYHRASPQTRVDHGQREYYDLRNSLYIYLVRYPRWMLLRFAPLKILLALVKGLSKGCLPEVARALSDVVRALPSLLRERKPIGNSTARLYIGLLRHHGPLRWDLGSWLRVKTGFGRIASRDYRSGSPGLPRSRQTGPA